MGAILARIKPPQFPDRVSTSRVMARKEGGKRIATDAIADGHRGLLAAGGGRVVVPQGAFLTGAIHLKSNVNLHLEEGATLLFSRDPKRICPLVFTRFEGTECMNYSPLIYAFEQTNIAVTGTGTLDGQADADHWWPGRATRLRTGGPPDEADVLVAMADKDVPVSQRIFGEGRYLRPDFLPAVPLHQRADRRRHHPQFSHVGTEPGAVPQRDGAQREDRRATAPITTAATRNAPPTC